MMKIRDRPAVKFLSISLATKRQATAKTSRHRAPRFRLDFDKGRTDRTSGEQEERSQIVLMEHRQIAFGPHFSARTSRLRVARMANMRCNFRTQRTIRAVS
jgi:hypothetical protein